VSWTHPVKRGASAVLARVGRTGLVDRYMPFLLHHVVERLRAPGVLPPEVRPCRLRGGLGVSVLCDPQSWSHRLPYWFGILFDRALEAFLRRILRPGDALVDVGANYGHFTMLAAALVHPGGVVHAFEPHPHLAELLKQHAASQPRIGRIHVWPTALSDTRGTMTLHVNPHWLGGSTLRADPNRESRTGRFTEEYQVDVARADDLALDLPPHGRLVVKIDVEGHEPAVIAGMARLLATADAVVVEVTPAWQGGLPGVTALFEAMQRKGFEAWDLTSLLDPEPQPGQPTGVLQRAQMNVLFSRPALRDFLRRA
jgi:FkbM family methyltransferase